MVKTFPVKLEINFYMIASSDLHKRILIVNMRSRNLHRLKREALAIFIQNQIEIRKCPSNKIVSAWEQSFEPVRSIIPGCGVLIEMATPRQTVPSIIRSVTHKLYGHPAH